MVYDAHIMLTDISMAQTLNMLAFSGGQWEPLGGRLTAVLQGWNARRGLVGCGFLVMVLFGPSGSFAWLFHR